MIVLIPIGIVQRYRVGTRRQRARRWVATLNLVGLSISTMLFLFVSSITAFWVDGALTYTFAGFAGGTVLGVLGLWLTRWEPGLDALHYTPNRLLVLSLTLMITARLLYGFWRAWESWRAGMSGQSWFVDAGVAGSMGAGAIVLGYYLIFWIGVRRRLQLHDARPLRRVSNRPRLRP